MDFAQIIDRVTERDSSKWEYEALTAIDADKDYLAYLRSPAASSIGPLTEQDKEMRDKHIKIRKTLGEMMRKHYQSMALNGGPSSLALEIEKAIANHDWNCDPETFMDYAIIKLTEAPA